MMKHLRIAALAGALAALQGCAGVALTAGGIAGGTGVDHTLSGISYKTFASPLANVRLATLKTLDKLDMTVKDDHRTDEGWQIEASARDRDIDITLESLTDRTTRMRCVVNKGEIFFKDASTSTEIILQTGETLAQQKQASR